MRYTDEAQHCDHSFLKSCCCFGAAKIAQIYRGMDSTGPLKVPCVIWHQDGSSWSFKSCKLQVGLRLLAHLPTPSSWFVLHTTTDWEHPTSLTLTQSSGNSISAIVKFAQILTPAHFSNKINQSVSEILILLLYLWVLITFRLIWVKSLISLRYCFDS